MMLANNITHNAKILIIETNSRISSKSIIIQVIKIIGTIIANIIKKLQNITLLSIKKIITIILMINLATKNKKRKMFNSITHIQIMTEY